MKKQKAIFLDRDGVINEDSKEYIKSCDEFKFLPKSREAIKLLNDNGFSVIIITNQSVINRKFVTESGLEKIFSKMKLGIEEKGGKILDIFYCPHVPEDNCECRKPKPKMILDAAKKFDIDVSSSCMIGDSAKDILCGINARCAKTILVKTGNGIKAENELKKMGISPDFTAENIYSAAKIITKKLSWEDTYKEMAKENENWSDI